MFNFTTVVFDGTSPTFYLHLKSVFSVFAYLKNTQEPIVD